jgi:hypothetical protein
MRYVAKDSQYAEIVADAGPRGDALEITVPSRKFLFTQASIVASVQLENNSHLIHPEFSKFVNNNGDTWSNESLWANHKSWIGAFNFVNHKASDDNGVGVILDVAMRRNYIDDSRNLHNYYADILIATHRDFPDLVKQIATGGIEYLSMGCDAYKIACSRCGMSHDGEAPGCGHDHGKGKYFIDRSGTRRISADILGTGDSGTVNFTEASWLTQPPAFHGAVKRNVLPIDLKSSVSITMPKSAMARQASMKFLGQKSG